MVLYLGGSHHSSCGCHIQAPLPKVHEGVITSIFCLDQEVIDFLSEKKQRHTEQASSNMSLLLLLPKCRAWQLASWLTLTGLKHQRHFEYMSIGRRVEKGGLDMAHREEEDKKGRREDGGGGSHDRAEPRGQEKPQIAKGLIAGE